MPMNPALGGGLAIAAQIDALESLLVDFALAMFASAYGAIVIGRVGTKCRLASLAHASCRQLRRMQRRHRELGGDLDISALLVRARNDVTRWPTEACTYVDQLRATLVGMAPRLRSLSQGGIEDLPTRRIADSAAQTVARELAELVQVHDHGDVLLPAFDRSSLLPGRDARFRVVDSYVRQRPQADRPPVEDLREALHNLVMGTEVPTIETCAICLFDCPDMPLEFHADMCRQMWDESRHARIFAKRLRELGGDLGQYPVDLRLWRMVSDEELALRLMIHQRIGEWLGVDAVFEGKRLSRRDGDEETAKIMDFVMADEITHVAIGNRWIRALVDESNLPALAAAAEQIRRDVGADVNGRKSYPINEWACSRSGFTAAELLALSTQRTRGERPAVPADHP